MTVMRGIKNHSHESLSRVPFLACDAMAPTAPPTGDMDCIHRRVTMMHGMLLIVRSMPTESTEGMVGIDGIDGIEGIEPIPALLATC